MMLALIFGLLRLSAQKWDWTTAKLGTFRVGYQKLEAKDYGRPFSLAPMAPRVLPLNVWYPTQQSSTQQMQFLDYVKNEKNASWLNHSASEQLQTLVKQYVDSSKISGFLSFQQYLIWLEEPNLELKKSYEEMLEMVRVFWVSI